MRLKDHIRTMSLTGWTGLVLAISCFIYFRFVTPYHLCFKEQIQLFAFNSTYLRSYFFKPAAMACLTGDFLTQFFLFKGLGAAIATALLAIEWFLVYLVVKRFHVVRYALLACFFPVIVDWLFFPGNYFSAAQCVSFIIALAGFLLYARLPEKTVVALLLPVLIFVIYTLAGATVFVFVFLVVIYDIHCGRRRFVYRAVISGVSFILPFITRHFYLLTSSQAFLYPFPDVLQASGLAIFAFIVLSFVCFKTLRDINSGIRNRAVVLALMAFVLIAGIIITDDREHEHLFGIVVESYHDNWDKVLEIAEKAQLNNPIATRYANMALSKKSLLGERLMEFYQPFASGLIFPNTKNVSWFDFFTCSDVFYYLGDTDMAQHAAMVGHLSSPFQRSARMVERLVETNTANGDLPVAMKYYRILASTLFHRMKPDIFENSSHTAAFRADTIREVNNTRLSLELMTESNPDNVQALDYLLCYHLLTANIPAFFKVYTSNYKEKNKPVPKVYAEALLIHFAMTPSPADETASYRIQPETVRMFGEYNRMFQMSNGNLDYMKGKFPDTYWLFYQYAVMNK